MSKQYGGDDDSDMSSVSSEGDESLRNGRNSGLSSAAFGRASILEKITIEVQPYLEEVVEEILAYVKESRYSDATDLWAKTKQEVNDIMQQVCESRASLSFWIFQMSRPKPDILICIFHHCHSRRRRRRRHYYYFSTKNPQTKN